MLGDFTFIPIRCIQKCHCSELNVEYQVHCQPLKYCRSLQDQNSIKYLAIIHEAEQKPTQILMDCQQKF